MDPIFTARPVDCQKECADCARDCPLSQCKRVQNGANQMPDKILKPAYFVALARMAWDGENLRLRSATEFHPWLSLDFSPFRIWRAGTERLPLQATRHAQHRTGETPVTTRATTTSTVQICNLNYARSGSGADWQDLSPVSGAGARCGCRRCACWDNSDTPRQNSATLHGKEPARHFES